MTDQTHSPLDASLTVPSLEISVYFEVSGRISIRGLTDGLANGAEVAILVLDSQGNSTAITAIVTDGAFEVLNLDERVYTPGNLTITASAGDVLAQQTLVLAAKPDFDPIVIDEQPVLNALNQLSIQGKAPSLEPGDEVQLVIRDVHDTRVLVTAAVQSDGRFSVQGISTQGLMDGTLFIDVMAQTSNGAISVMNATNLELVTPTPEGADRTLALSEDTTLALTVAHFGYDNSAGFNLTGIKIAGLPSAGVLQLNGQDVVMDDFVTVTQLNAGQLVYKPPFNANGTALGNFKFKVMDDRPLNNEDRVANTITFNVTAVNDAAVISGTSTGAVIEAGGVANAIVGTPTATGTLTSTDVDGTPNAFTAVATATTSIGGYGTYVMTAGGVWTYTLNNSNVTVQALAEGVTLNDTFTVNAADGTPKIITVTISGTNDAAVIGGVSTGSLTETNAVQSVTGNLTISDVDNPANFKPAAVDGIYGRLSLNSTGAWTYTMFSANDQFARGVVYNDSFVAEAADGTQKTINITINGTNDAPVLTPRIAPNLYSMVAGDAAPVNGVTTGTSVSSLVGGISDVDEGALVGIAITAVNTNGSLYFSTNSGATWTQIIGLNATQQFGLSDAAQNRVYFVRNAGVTQTLTDAFTFRAWDRSGGAADGSYINAVVGGIGAASVNTDTVSATMPANTAPVNTVPGPQTTNEDVNKVITGLSVADGDVGNNPMTVTLAVTNGTLTLLTGTGVTLTGNNSTSVQLSGTLSAINTLLATANAVTYKPTANFNGSGQLTMTSSDGTLSDTDIVAITVNAVNDAPTGANKTIPVLEDGSYTLTASDFGFADAFDTPANSLSALMITSLPAAGTLTLGGSPVTLNQSISVGSLGSLVYAPAANGNGSTYATIGFKVVDNGGTANGGQNTSVNANTLTFNVTAVNDAPVNTVPGSQTTNENTNKVITGLSVIDVDAVANPMTVTLAVTNGTLTLLTGTGVTLTGNNSTSVQLSGTLSAINTLLATANAVTYKPTANFNGSAVLTMTSSDGTLSDSDTVTISVRPEGFRGTAQSQLGYEVSNLGDVNGDGFEDVIIGAPGTNGAASSAYVLYGNAAGEGISLTGGTIALSRGFKISGVGDDETGHSVSSAGDINGDGFNDILVGSYGRDAGGGSVSEGATFIIYGGASGNHVNLSNFQASQGVRITGADNERSGHSVSNAGDVNGDGLNDIIVGAIISGQPEEIGAAYVIYGRTSGMDINLFSNTTLDPSRGFKLVGVTGSDGATIIGNAVSSAGDFNGDGFADVILGAANHNDAYIIFGGPNGQTGGDVISLVNSGQGVHINGLDADMGLGSRVTGLGDFNGDGFADVAMVGNNADSNSVARIIYGRSTSGTINVSSAASTTSGFGLSASISTGVGDRIDKISGAGDMNGDGLADLMVAGFNLANYQGWTYVVYGSTNASNLALNGPIAASRGFMLQGTFMGEGLSTAGDFNGDGLDDLILGFGSNANVNSIGGYSIVLGGTQWVSSAIKGSGAVNGTTSNEAIVGSDGNDTLVGGGGVDRFYAGKGNDTLVLTASDVTALAATTGAVRALVDGGTGYDTLRLSGGVNLNLTGVTNVGAMGLEENSRIEGIERIDLATDTAVNTLTLTARDVNDMGGFNLIHTGSVSADGKTWTNVSGTALAATSRFHQLVVDGTATDQMLLMGPGQWASVGTVNDGTHNYVVHQNSANQSQVIVRQGVGVTVDDAPVLIGSNPSDNGFMMNVTNHITLTFSEAVKKGTGLIQLYKADGTLVQSFDAAATSTALTWSGNQLTINPDADLEFSTGYYLKISPTAVKDLTGNAYAGITDNTSLNFTTVDDIGVVVVDGVPAGWAVSTAGDVNGDGYDDVIIGFPSSGQAQPWITYPPSTAFVLYGNSNGTLPAFPAGSTFGTFGTLAADKGFKIQGVSGALVGTSVSSAGDINGDGLSDLIVGGPGYAAGDSMPTYVVYGSTRNTDVLVNFQSIPLASSLGFKIDSTPGMGRTVANAGDVNGDGLADIIVTSANDATPPSYAGAYASETYVLFGNSNGVYPSSVSSTTVLNASQGFRIISPGGQGRFIAASSLGDVNGDGYADILVKEASKGVHVVYGGSQPITVNLTDGSFNSSQGYTIQTDFDSSNKTGDITGLGDINGDGLSDFAFSNPGAGQVTVVYGSTTPINMLDLRGDATVDAKLGFRISVQDPRYQQIGTGIANAGDMNGDGYDDMVFGLQNDSYGWVVYGGPDNTIFQLPLSGAIAPSRGFQFKTNAGNGEILATAGDFNGDGLSDLVFGWGILLGGTQWVSHYILVGNGTSAGEAMMGTAGNDTLVGGGGVDRFYAGKGNDTIVITASDVANLANNSAAAAKSVIDAGNGYDTLRLSGGANLNLLTITNAGASGSKADSRIDSIERIDLATDSDANTVTLSALDVNDMAGFDRIHIGSVSEDGKTWSNVTGAALSTTTQYHQLVVDGGSNDVLNLQNGLGVWVNAGTVSDGTNPYVVYQNANSHSQVLVRSGVQTLINDPPLLLGSSPSDNGFMMKMDDSITLTYSEAIYQGVGVIELYRADDTLVESFDVATSTKITGWGAAGNTLTINPTADLTVGTGYYIKVSTTAITDATGVAFAPVNDKTTLNFTTVNADGSVNGTSSLGGGVKSVSSVGDVNGDGFDDFAVGANGAAYVIYGSASPFLPDLSSISNLPSRGFQLTDAPGANLGASVSGLGDINGDGYADLIVGANNYNVSNSEGIARVIYGGANMGSTPTSAFTLLGGYYGALGQSVSGIGDFNGDGINDMIAGAPGTNSSAGVAYIVYGSSNLTSTIQVGNSSYPMEASTGFYLSGVAASGEKAGYSVSGAGDVNGDGLADVVVGAYNALSGKGAAYVIFGTTTSTSGALADRVAAGGGFRIDGDTGQGLGYQVASAGDVNGDGLGDVIVSTNSTNADFSAAYVVFGKASTTGVTVSNLSASQGFSILGGSAESYIRGVSSAGDMNGDGLSDLIVGAKNGDTYVVYGKSSGTSVNLSSATIATSAGFKIDSRFYDDAYGGLNTQLIESVSSAGDINGDGLSDLIIGISSDDSNGGYSVLLGGTQWVTSAVYSNRGTVTGATLSEALIGGVDNETLIGGGGVDRFYAGMGNDTIVLTLNDVTNLTTTTGAVRGLVNGGSGYDTIRLSGGAGMFLPSISNAGAMGLEENSRIESIERIDLATDTGDNHLTLQSRDVRDMAGFNQIRIGSVSADGKTWTNVTGTALSATTQFHQLVVDGGSNDTLTLSVDLGFWTAVGTVNNGTHNYTVYQNTGGRSQVLVRDGVTVTNNDSVAPVVLDLNRDGDLAYSQMLMDINSDGRMDLTAWAAAEDGVLVWDKHGDGLVHDHSQYAFAQYAGFAGASDLQGLAEAFDSNRDGVFDGQDAQFSQFVVWQDLDQDGTSDAGEVRSLADWGISAIGLKSDGVVQAPALGVQEAGRSTAQMADGTQMVVADAAFAYQTVPQMDLAGFVSQVRSDKAMKGSLLDAQDGVKLFLYDMIQGAKDAALSESDLFSAAESHVHMPERPIGMGAMDLLAEQLMAQTQG